MKKPRYRCPQCGKKVVFNEHFCAESKGGGLDPGDFNNPKAPQSGKGLIKKLGTVLIVAFLAGAMLWPFLDWKSTLVVGFLILAGAGIVLLAGTRRKAAAGSHYRSLVKLAGGDRNVAERLINAELARYPDFSRSECIRRVHDRLEYEHRR